MSTNYYWVRPFDEKLFSNHETNDVSDDLNPVYHIGKTSGIGGGQVEFLWAQPPFLVENMLLVNSDTFIVRDEYDTLFTGEQFYNMLLIAKYENRVGQWFC